MRQIMATILVCLALFATPVTALSDGQKSALIEDCSSIKQSLRTLQRSDSRTRVYLGSVYQIALSNYITPLNLRLVKNNQPTAALSTVQTSFTTAREEFSQKFITYSQSLEELIQIDCTKNPETFYNKLSDARDKRKDLAAATAKVEGIFDQHIEDVAKLKEDLK